MDAAKNSALLLLSAYSAALAHSLRTPLATIANDINAMALTGEVDVSRMLKKCRELSDILSSAALQMQTSFRHSAASAPLAEYVEYAEYLQGGDQLLSRLGQAEHFLTEAFQRLCVFFKHWLIQDSPVQIRIAQHYYMGANHHIECSLPLNGHASFSQLGSQSFSSFTDLFCVKLGINSYDLPVADAVLAAAGWNVLIDGGSLLLSAEFKFTLEGPAAV